MIRLELNSFCLILRHIKHSFNVSYIGVNICMTIIPSSDGDPVQTDRASVGCFHHWAIAVFRNEMNALYLSGNTQFILILVV